MDTLIDNRNFPQEMQEHLDTSKPKKDSRVFIIILILLALVTFAYLTFFKKDESNIKDSTRVEEQVKNIKAIQSQSRIITKQQRDEKIATFFN